MRWDNWYLPSLCYSVWLHLNFCPTEGAATAPALRVLPGCETGSAEEVPTRLYPDVFGVLRADLAELEGWAHLAVELVLLLRHSHVVLGGGLDRPGEVGVDTPAVRVEITETSIDEKVELQGEVILQSFSGSVQQSLAQWLVLRNCLQNIPVCSDVAYRPLPQPGAGQSEDVAPGLVDVTVQSRLHLVVGEEGHVARVCDGQDLPVP